MGKACSLCDSTNTKSEPYWDKGSVQYKLRVECRNSNCIGNLIR